MRKLCIVSGLALSLATLVGSAAADPYAPGTVTFSPSLAFNRSTANPTGGGDPVSLTNLNLNAAVGRCMTDRIELSGGPMFIHNVSDGTGRNGFGAMGGATANFASAASSVIPFMSANVGFVSYSADGESQRTTLLPMVRAGIRTMIGDTRTMNVSIGYQHEKNPDTSTEESIDAFDVAVGLSLLNPRD